MFKNRSYCGELSIKDVDKRVELAGWVESNRNLGGIIFIKLRDVSGTVQVVVDSSSAPALVETADHRAALAGVLPGTRAHPEHRRPARRLE